MELNNLFPWDDLLPVQVVEQTTSPALDAVPTEIIDLVASFLPRRTLPTFALVNSRCRAVATRHIYHSVTISGHLFSIRPRDPANKLPDAESPISEIMEAGKIRACRILKGLLANDHHIAAVREFQIVGHPLWSDRPYFVAFIKHIWQKATSLMKVNHQYFPAKPVCLPDPCWPESLRHLESRHICWWSLKALAPASMRRLTMKTCTSTTRKLLERDLTHITHFEYQWHDWKDENFDTFNFDWIGDAFPNVRTLRIGICDCWLDQGIPEKIYTAALCKLVSKLFQLETFILGERHERTAFAEESLLNELEHAQPSLNKITFQWRIREKSQAAEATWSRSGASLMTLNGSPRKRYPGEIRWTPDPMLVDRLDWWFTQFGIPCISRPEMLRRWQSDAWDIPTEQILSKHALQMIRAELLKEGKCSREAKGSCDCVLCKC